MTKQRFSFLLILLMVMTSVASAFDHCSGMVMSGQFPENQSLIVVGIDNNASTSSHQVTDQEPPQNQLDMHCHLSGSCTFHACGVYGITSSASSSAFIAAYSFSSFESKSPYDTPFSPELRPPS